MTEMGDINTGDVIEVPCPNCQGKLRADKFIEKPSTQVEWQSPIVDPFWTTTCVTCEHRFNYLPQTGQLTPL